MNEKRPGRELLEERVAREHAQLEPLFEATRAHLSQREPRAALESISELRRSLEAHTAQEDHLYYPALWSLCPHHKPALEVFIRSHEQFRLELAEIVDRVGEGELALAASRFDAFSRSFATHEVYEEALLREIDAEAPWGDPAPSA